MLMGAFLIRFVCIAVGPSYYQAKKKNQVAFTSALPLRMQTVVSKQTYDHYGARLNMYDYVFCLTLSLISTLHYTMIHNNTQYIYIYISYIHISYSILARQARGKR